MKKEYFKPVIMGEKFVANEYVSYYLTSSFGVYHQLYLTKDILKQNHPNASA